MALIRVLLTNHFIKFINSKLTLNYTNTLNISRLSYIKTEIGCLLLNNI